MRLRTLLVLVFGLAFVAVQGRSMWMARRNAAAAAESAALYEQVSETARTLERVRTVALDLETGVRGWLLTHERGFREPYDRASRARALAVEELARHTRGDREASWSAAQIREQLEAWERDVARPLLATTEGVPTAPAQHALNVDGRQRMETVRAHLEMLERHFARRRTTALASIEAQRQGIARDSTLLGLAIGAFLLAAALVAARSVERPLAEVVARARRIGDDDFEPLAPRGVTEVRALADAVSGMAAQLAAERDREKSFAALVAGLAAGGDVKTLATAALRSLVDGYHASAGVLWIVRSPGGPLERVASLAIDPATLPPEGDALVREVRDAGRRVRVEGGHATELRVVRSALTDVVPRALLVAPLAAGPEVVGVVELASASGTLPSDEELTRVCTRIALALRNALEIERGAALARAVAEQRARLEAVFAALSEAVLLVDAEGVVQMSNAAAQRTVGRELVGRPLADLAGLYSSSLPDGLPVPPEDIPGSPAYLAGGQPLRDALRRVVAPDGTVSFQLLDAVPVQLAGQPAGLVLVARDVTAAHHLREQLARANEELQAQNEELQAQEEELRSQADELSAQQRELARRNEELARASRLKSDFLASMSHELRTPLNAVIGFSEVLLAGTFGPLEGRQRACVEDVLTAGRHLLLLINDVLDLSKIEAGRVDLKVASVDLGEPVAQACGLLADSARQQQLRIENRVTARAKFVQADPDKLRQVLLNLISNAVKFTPAGGSITVVATEQGERVRVEVVDTGIGIEPIHASRLFVPFSQIETHDARRFAGTGLGLSICKRLIELMGGEIGFRSEPGRGSTFFFTLPRAAEVVDGEKALVPAGRVRPVRALPPSEQGALPLVLVVEDWEADARVVEASLARAGYAVRVAGSGAEALRTLDEITPTLLIVDLGLPDLPGLALIEQVRRRPALAEVPIVVLTARDLSSEERARFDGVADRVVQKGALSRADFVACIAALCPPAPSPATAAVRVLVVDDSEMNRRVLRAMLEAVRCEVLEADGATSGQQLAREHQPAVVLMDIQMPGTDGLTATRALRADPVTAHIPVIAVTALAMQGDADKSHEAGCVAYVSKPVARAELYASIGRALGRTDWAS
jgi:signal transduction histidine kinase/DNA-binding response OmpR family regulator